jgi:hypothetical protein
LRQITAKSKRSIKRDYLLFYDEERGYSLWDRDGKAYSFPAELGKFKRIHLSEDNIFRAEGDGKEIKTGYFIVETGKKIKKCGFRALNSQACLSLP